MERERALEWARENPVKKGVKRHRRRARKAEAKGHYNAADWDAIIDAQNGRCLACGKKKNLTVDHIVPLAAGGTNWPDNLQGLCKSCNSRKGTKTIDYRPKGGLIRWIQSKLF
jgi:5-methylcytosine-specific restriction endonuclease McrA